eukprot:CAMPEP_0180232652 /NCGR_PEP_ID=MMETSP0987-20121128/27596_1 /TAXON_ID=697907 /ORGANISM="non described non described, Strain CCMP2293" /LENGTH=543 /DNA_ID=CAMNT_0022198297 /DNA_START=142 /DNA_END=1775 /DNA_ORIENTATION=-
MPEQVRRPQNRGAGRALRAVVPLMVMAASLRVAAGFAPPLPVAPRLSALSQHTAGAVAGGFKTMRCEGKGGCGKDDRPLSGCGWMLKTAQRGKNWFWSGGAPRRRRVHEAAPDCYGGMLHHAVRVALPPERRGHRLDALRVADPLGAVASAAVSSEEARTVAEAWKVLGKAYVDQTFNGVDWQATRQKFVSKGNYKNMDEAYQGIRDMCKLLGDKYTRFLTPAQYSSITQLYQASGVEFGGIGVEMTMDTSNTIIVASTYPGSPAERAGLKKGDAIKAVSGVQVGGKIGGTADEAASLLRGTVGTEVAVTVTGFGGMNRDVTVAREVINMRPVTASVVDVAGETAEENMRVGILRIPVFSKDTSAQVLELIDSVRIEKGAQAILLDLRGNVGGSFPTAVDLAKELLPQDQTIVYAVDRNGERSEYRTEGQGSEQAIPIAVLVDKSTASAAEVLTAALQENGRAKVIGEQTFGKGLVQTIAPLQGGAALVITVSTYETPHNHNINKVGIAPDVENDRCVKAQSDKDLAAALSPTFFQQSSVNVL